METIDSRHDEDRPEQPSARTDTEQTIARTWRRKLQAIAFVGVMAAAGSTAGYVTGSSARQESAERPPAEAPPIPGEAAPELDLTAENMQQAAEDKALVVAADIADYLARPGSNTEQFRGVDRPASGFAVPGSAYAERAEDSDGNPLPIDAGIFTMKNAPGEIHFRMATAGPDGATDNQLYSILKLVPGTYSQSRTPAEIAASLRQPDAAARLDLLSVGGLGEADGSQVLTNEQGFFGDKGPLLVKLGSLPAEAATPDSMEEALAEIDEQRGTMQQIVGTTG